MWLSDTTERCNPASTSTNPPPSALALKGALQPGAEAAPPPPRSNARKPDGDDHSEKARRPSFPEPTLQHSGRHAGVPLVRGPQPHLLELLRLRIALHVSGVEHDRPQRQLLGLPLLPHLCRRHVSAMVDLDKIHDGKAQETLANGSTRTVYGVDRQGCLRHSPILQNSSTGRILYRSGSLWPMPTTNPMISCAKSHVECGHPAAAANDINRRRLGTASASWHDIADLVPGCLVPLVWVPVPHRTA